MINTVCGRSKKIMLLDAYSTRTLACVRSFGARGISFVVGGQTKHDMSLYSRYCHERFVYTSPYVSIEAFLGDVARCAKQFKVDWIFPTSEAGILACQLRRHGLGAELLAPSTQQIDILFKKWETIKLAESVGMPVPKTHRIGLQEVDRVGHLDLNYPVIIKANSSSSIQGDRVMQGGDTVYVYTAEDLRAQAAKRLAHCPEILIQEFINGYGVGISGIFQNGWPVALFGHRRIHETNPLGGPSAVAVSIPVSDEMRTATTKLMGPTGYTGAAMVEYKIDRATGTPYLMEVNCRLWGSILLPLAAGLDLPYLLWKVLNGEGVDPRETVYQEGVIGRQILSDTKHLLSVLKGRPASWPGHFPKRWETITDYVTLFFSGRVKNLLLTEDDPRPAVGLLMQHLLA